MGLVISQAALHAALVELRYRGLERELDGDAVAFLIDGLNVLIALLDPRHGIAAGTAPDQAGAPAPPIINLPDDPGSACAAGAATSSAVGALNEPAPPAPPPAQAAEEHSAPEPEASDAPPGERRPRNGRLAARLTPERAAVFAELWRDPSLRNREIRDRLNALPGLEIPGDPALYAMAERLGLPKRGALGAVPQPSPLPPLPDPDEPPAQPIAAPPDAQPRPNGLGARAALPAIPPEKAEVFDAFAGGMTVRDVAAEFGIAMSTLTNWHAEWKLRTKEAAS